MTKLTLPGDIGRQLTATHDCVELCDEGGRTIGFFTPAVEGALGGPRVSDEELTRREREEPTYSTGEVLAHLRAL
jgi:hypothetical protein